MHTFVILSTLVAFLLEGANTELFTSNAHLQTALYAERDIAGLLRNYVDQEEMRLQKLRQLADDYSEHSNQALANIDKYLGNPINAFLLIKKFTLDWDRDIIPVINNSSAEYLNQELDIVRSDLPTYEDLKGAAAALMRLQDTYQLDTSSVAHGKLAGVTSPSLSAEECFELGRLSYNDGDFYHTKLWMDQALDDYRVKKLERSDAIKSGALDIGRPSGRVKGELGDSQGQEEEEEMDEEFETLYWGPDGSKAQVLDYLAFSHYKLGDLPVALELTNELLTLDPTHERANNNKRYFEKMLQDDENREPLSEEKKRTLYQTNRDDYRNSEEFLTYEALCRGEEIMPIKDRHKLTCRYVTNNHPLLLLQPAKEEEMHLDPWIVVYHDVMSDEEIRQIKQLATPRLNRATVQNAKTGELETANYRISKSAWLRGEDHPVVKKMNDRMEAITGLNLETAEELQIANYGLGGHYEPHFDFARKEEKDAFKSLGTGNRIATFLNYMSDVEAGGATVFPYLGLKLYPKKGDSAFWYNLYKTGDGIFSTRHAACPVLVGVKWVANKWLHERGQEFKRPCGLEPDD
ncbi:prolyl 4-hydroxylase subunit alpha-1 [Plakobranchus ocellatus]|uniref:procollagen-proline 4-dioxygenase n=1 Tax=Plakobranchus ocellatus TaxID=259542 RepID=A0AAV3Y691_9GAST|nr:prolyl 4-hydroxylase subunit alpha-1 [Plakobranchus ocellatus]